MSAGTGRPGAAAPRGRAWTFRGDAAQPGHGVGLDPPSDAQDDLREILITVSRTQFEAFARDLELLRQHGAASNTQAIIDAVRERAARIKVGAVDERNAA